MSQGGLGEVFTADELARAARVGRSEVDALLASGGFQLIPGTRYLSAKEAVAAGRCLRQAALSTSRPTSTQEMFAVSGRRPRVERRAIPAVASSVIHAVLMAIALWFSAGAANTAAVDDPPQRARLVFVLNAGPGGRGGGGGLRSPLPAPRLHRQGAERRHVSVPPVAHTPTPVARREVETTKPIVVPVPRPIERPLEPLPSRVLVAPVVAAAASTRERDGEIDRERETEPSSGAGRVGGVGTGQGLGNGDGEGGGAGGGPLRPGSGIDPPRLRREIKVLS